MDSPQNPRSSDVLKLPADRVGGNASVMASVLASWDEIDVALTPIIGQQGVAALYKRSVHLAARAHPWLAVVLEGSGKGSAISDAVVDLDALKNAFQPQDVTEAKSAAEAILRNFFELLTNLIGSSLTERLLHSVWANFLSEPSKQDFSP